MTYRHPGRARQRHGRTGFAAVTVGCVLSVVIGACSAGSNGTVPGSAGVASLAGQSGRTRGALKPLTTQQSDQDFVNFAHCMRVHGVAMSDPFHRPGHNGLSIDMPTQDAATRPAYTKCIHFIQTIVDVKQAGAAAQAAPHLAALTRYAQCMRGHDINMLDPTPQGELNLGSVPGITSDFGRDSPQFRAADSGCRHFLPTGISDDGTGP
ncbi:MAG: hypothetical protein ACLQFR_30415 [Streptosporangiaceae bacterium]